MKSICYRILLTLALSLGVAIPSVVVALPSCSSINYEDLLNKSSSAIENSYNVSICTSPSCNSFCTQANNMALYQLAPGFHVVAGSGLYIGEKALFINGPWDCYSVCSKALTELKCKAPLTLGASTGFYFLGCQSE